LRLVHGQGGGDIDALPSQGPSVRPEPRQGQDLGDDHRPSTIAHRRAGDAVRRAPRACLPMSRPAGRWACRRAEPRWRSPSSRQVGRDRRPASRSWCSTQQGV